MSDNSKRPKDKAEVLSTLDMAINGVDLAKKVARIELARAVFGTVALLLVMIRVSFPLFCGRCSRFTPDQDTMVNEQDYVDLGLFCGDICKALERGISGKKLRHLSKPVCDAMNRLTT